jgi:hypothetical protein
MHVSFYVAFLRSEAFGDPTGPCYWKTQRFWDGYAWRVRRVRVCG